MNEKQKFSVLEIELNKPKNIKSRIKPRNFFDKLFKKLDEANDADKIVSYYIIERIFGFNLCHKMVEAINKSHKPVINSTEDLLGM